MQSNRWIVAVGALAALGVGLAAFLLSSPAEKPPVPVAVPVAPAPAPDPKMKPNLKPSPSKPPGGVRL